MTNGNCIAYMGDAQTGCGTFGTGHTYSFTTDFEVPSGGITITRMDAESNANQAATVTIQDATPATGTTATALMSCSTTATTHQCDASGTAAVPAGRDVQVTISGQGSAKQWKVWFSFGG